VNESGVVVLKMYEEKIAIFQRTAANFQQNMRVLQILSA